MFKRANKITSLLVAAAAVVSIVPASAADYKKVESQDGTIYNAVAYKDGSFYLDGEVEDKEEAAYLLDGGNFKALEDVDSGDTATAYGEKYVEIEEGDYYVDLETGEVTDDSIREDLLDDAATALRKELKDDEADRYVVTAGADVLANNTIEAITGNKFAAEWFQDDVAKAALYEGNANGQASFHVYTDAEGNYIDADHNLGKINAVVTTGDGVSLKNTNDDDEGVTANITHVETIAQDKDFIYRLADLNVIDKDGNAIYTFGNSNDSVTVTTGGAIRVIQKISKAQDSGDIDDAKFAKTTATYFVTNDEGDVKSYYDNFTVVDGKLLNYEVVNGQVFAKAITLKSTNGYYYTDFSDGTDVDDIDAVETDVDGNLYILEGGYIQKFDMDEDFDNIYKVDGSFTELSVYDEENMVAWDEDDEVYSLIGGTTEAPVETPAVTTGWAQAADGTWTYVNADGTKATGWLNLGGTWYYLKADGVMATGWVQDAGTWYYLAGSGAMQTGWLNDNGTWYYLAGSGAMLANTTVDGYVLGASGAWIK